MPLVSRAFDNEQTNWRFATPPGEVRFTDRFAGPQVFEPARTIGDFAVWTKRAQNEALRRALTLDEGAIHQNVELKKALNYKGPPSVADFDRIDTSVVANPQSALEESVVIGAGSADGVLMGSVVVEPIGGPDGTGALVGTVDRVTAHDPRVTLLTDTVARHGDRRDEPAGDRRRSPRRRLE
jgi:hypothetical protein